MARAHSYKVVIGRSGLIDFIEPAIQGVPAKTDTGAYRSAVHADQISLSPDGKTLSFRLLGGHPICGVMAKSASTTNFSKVNVSNSFGHEEERYEVKLKVKVGPKIFMASFSLANRKKKVYPILLGRTLLNDRFLIDTAHSSVKLAELNDRWNIDFPLDKEGGRE